MLDQTVLDRAFRGELTPQDPDDEPASALLERIRAEHEAGKVPNRPARRGKQPDKDRVMANEETYTNLALDL